MKKITLALAAGALVASLAACSGKANDKAAEAAATDSTATVTVSPLSVKGTALINAEGDTVVLNGPSLGWHSNWGRFYNDSTIMAIKEKWGANVTRAAIGAHKSWDCVNTFDADSTYAYECAFKAIDAAIANGLYIICDWHSHENTLDNAKKFFTTITEKYGDSPNIIYEIWNEPLQIQWQEIKDYANELIPLIRKNAPNSVIIVGTPSWDQEVDKAAADPLTQENLMYALHFYAATHKDYLRETAEKAIADGLPIFISECASMEATGDGPIDYESWQAWVDLADRHKLSMLLWDIADKDETCSMIMSTASDNGMNWTDADLKEWAKTAIKTIKTRNGIAE